MAEKTIAKRLRITGNVQGVSFRAFTHDTAEEAGLDGWVRNEADGSVRALVSGPRDSVERLVERLRTGPPGAWVDAIEEEDATGETVPAGFHVTG
ncbi:acylphosphatase [Pararhizobium mangrovi]|uniref:Acylphosphatase n=1 Tax=Pararhizobium mangrovi TaxID=2590452 RepID=A0A506TV57_9HYPH|nr:acylphosphatase [Pararhizobium mangrovi]TPW25952.1 acylphosphatase [Pararhizobium mangrovi]